MEMEIENLFAECYPRTIWGLFYSGYKELGQLQLQKAMEKNKNELSKTKTLNPYEKTKWVQHIFYMTDWNEPTKSSKTPQILLRHTKRGFDDPHFCEDINLLRETANIVTKKYLKRCLAEHNEVKVFYAKRKEELKVEATQKHKEKANECVACPFCCAQVTRTNLAKHRKTNKKCLAIQEEKEKDI